MVRFIIEFSRDRRGFWTIGSINKWSIIVVNVLILAFLWLSCKRAVPRITPPSESEELAAYDQHVPPGWIRQLQTQEKLYPLEENFAALFEDFVAVGEAASFITLSGCQTGRLLSSSSPITETTNSQNTNFNKQTENTTGANICGWAPPLYNGTLYTTSLTLIDALYATVATQASTYIRAHPALFASRVSEFRQRWLNGTFPNQFGIQQAGGHIDVELALLLPASSPSSMTQMHSGRIDLITTGFTLVHSAWLDARRPTFTIMGPATALPSSAKGMLRTQAQWASRTHSALRHVLLRAHSDILSSIPPGLESIWYAGFQDVVDRLGLTEKVRKAMAYASMLELIGMPEENSFAEPSIVKEKAQEEYEDEAGWRWSWWTTTPGVKQKREYDKGDDGEWGEGGDQATGDGAKDKSTYTGGLYDEEEEAHQDQQNQHEQESAKTDDYMDWLDPPSRPRWDAPHVWDIWLLQTVLRIFFSKEEPYSQPGSSSSSVFSGGDKADLDALAVAAGRVATKLATVKAAVQQFEHVVAVWYAGQHALQVAEVERDSQSEDEWRTRWPFSLLVPGQQHRQQQQEAEASATHSQRLWDQLHRISAHNTLAITHATKLQAQIKAVTDRWEALGQELAGIVRGNMSTVQEEVIHKPSEGMQGTLLVTRTIYSVPSVEYFSDKLNEMSRRTMAIIKGLQDYVDKLEGEFPL